VTFTHLLRNRYMSWGHVSTIILSPESSRETQSVRSRNCSPSCLRVNGICDDDGCSVIICCLRTATAEEDGG
jgi:hypothetical protein